MTTIDHEAVYRCTTRNTVVTGITGKFWTGRWWSEEYPDAKHYTEAEAKRVALTLPFAQAIRNYGNDDQQQIS